MEDIAEILEGIIRSEGIFKTIFNEAPIGMLVSDHKGNIRLSNKRLERMLGYENDLVGRNETDLMFDEEEKRILEEQNLKRKVGEVSYYELRWKKSDGERVDTEVTAVPLYSNKVFLGNFAFIKDVTKDKKLEKRLRSTDKIQVLQDTSAKAWHAMRNLSTAVIGYLDLWLKHETGPEKREQMQYVLGNQQKIMNIIDNFQSLVGPLSEGKKEEYDLNEIINEELKFLKVSLLSRYNVVEELGPSVKVYVDKQGLGKEVLLNLVKNSVEAIGDNPGTVTIGSRIKNGFVEVYIRDSGCDITEPDKIFNLFYTTKETGSGVGLHVVKSIIKEHKGYVGLNTTPKEFYFALPIVDRNT